MPQIRVTPISGSIPTINQFALGDIVLNTYDGKAYIKKQVGATQTVLEVGSGTVPVSSSYSTTSSYSVTSSFASTASYYGGTVTTASYALTASYWSGSVTSASFSSTASYYGGTVTTASYALTSSFVNPLNQNVVITGSTTISSSAATQLRVGSNLLFVSSSGAVGIGTINPIGKLYISGSSQNTLILDSPAYPELTHRVSGTIKSYDAIVTTDGGYFSTSTTDDRIFRAQAGNLLFGYQANEYLRITTAGAVGINNSSPGYLLDVNGTLGISGASTFASTISVTGVSTFKDKVNIGLDASSLAPSPLTNLQVMTPGAMGAYPTLGTAGGGFFLAGDITNYGLFAGVNNVSGNAWMQVMRDDSAQAYHMLLQPVGGYVVIGTTTVSAKLQVRGAGTTSATKTFLAEDASANPLLTVLDNGNVGIGTSSPSFLLDVTGLSRFTSGLTVTGSVTASSLTVGVITSTPSTENTLNVYSPFGAGTGEGGQILLAASGGLYTSASMLDNYQNQIRILKGTNTGGSTTSYFSLNLDNGNTQFTGAVTASAYSGLPNNYLYVTRNTNQTIGGGNWANQDIIFNNLVYSSGIAYNTVSGLASLTADKVYRITARLAWSAAASYLLQFSCYNSVNSQLGPTVEIVQSTNASNNISDGTLEFIYAPVSNVDIKIRTTGATSALSGEYIRGDLNTQLIIQQIA